MNDSLETIIEFVREEERLYRRDGEIGCAETLDEIADRLAALPKQEWQPIETAPKDGTVVLVANEYGTWVAKYVAVYQSGYRPENPWQSMMLNHEHMRKGSVLHFAAPTHWQHLPPPPTVAEREVES